jgi:hypothetical protein
MFPRRRRPLTGGKFLKARSPGETPEAGGFILLNALFRTKNSAYKRNKTEKKRLFDSIPLSLLSGV